MFFVHDCKVYSLPEEAVAMDGQGAVPTSYRDFVAMTDKAKAFGSECFLSRKTFGDEYIKIVQTKAGLVWCSCVSVNVPAQMQRAFAIAEEVGGDFLWTWSAGKARTSYWKYRDAEVKFGHYQTLAHLPPATFDYGLSPTLIEGCQEIAWEALTSEQRFFLSHLNPSRASLAIDTEQDKAFATGVERCIDRRKRRHRPSTPPPHFFQSAEDDLDKAEAACPPFFNVRRVSPREQEGYIGAETQVKLADWSALAEDTSSEILKIVADEAFQSDWKNYECAQAVAQLRLVCRSFQNTLDAQLTALWKQNADFSRRVLKGSRQAPPSVRPQLALPEIVTLNERADTWRKLAVLRKVSGVSRHQRHSPFFSQEPGPTRRRLFGDDILTELQSINSNVRTTRLLLR